MTGCKVALQPKVLVGVVQQGELGVSVTCDIAQLRTHELVACLPEIHHRSFGNQPIDQFVDIRA